MATKNNPGAFDCYLKAEPDEPMFILLGRDPMAPSLVELWARARAAGGEQPAKVVEAYACAESMRRWLVKVERDEKPVAITVVEEISEAELRKNWVGDPPQGGFENYRANHGVPLRVVEYRAPISLAEGIAQLEAIGPLPPYAREPEPPPKKTLAQEIHDDAMAKLSTNWPETQKRLADIIRMRAQSGASTFVRVVALGEVVHEALCEWATSQGLSCDKRGVIEWVKGDPNHVVIGWGPDTDYFLERDGRLKHAKEGLGTGKDEAYDPTKPLKLDVDAFMNNPGKPDGLYNNHAGDLPQPTAPASGIGAALYDAFIRPWRRG